MANKRTMKKGTKRRGTMKRGGSKSKATFNKVNGKPENHKLYFTWGSRGPAPPLSHLGRPSKGKLNSAQKAMNPKK